MNKHDLNIYKMNIAFFLRSFLLLTPITLFFYQENGLTVQTLFLFQGIFYLTSICSEIPVGYLSDKFSKKNIILVSFVLFLLRSLLWITCRGYWIIMLGEILFAISKVMMDNTMSGYLYDYLSSKNKSNKIVKYYGFLNFFLATGTSLAALAGTYIYKMNGSKTVLLGEMILIIIAILLMSTMPQTKPDNSVKHNKSKDFVKYTQVFFRNKAIINYVLYSGLLTSCSVLFALSFQPLMQHSLFPLMYFGVVAFINHILRALSSAISGLAQKYCSIRTLIIPLYFLYLGAFALIFKIINSINIKLNFAFIIIICIIIGCQLLFTIMHIGRLHHMVSVSRRGAIMSVNNFISRFMTATILLSSKFFIDKLGLQNFYIIVFAIFFIIASYLMVSTYKIKEFV